MAAEGAAARPKQETKAGGLGVDADVVKRGGQEHPQLRALRKTTKAHPWAVMQISPDEGFLLRWLMPLMGGWRAFEFGVFT